MIAFIDFPEWLTPFVIPGLPIRWYGLMYLVAFAVTFVLVRRDLARPHGPLDQPLSTDDTVNLFFWTILGLLLGARIVSAIVYDTTGVYLRRPWRIVWPFDERMNFVGLQGMSYHGGLAGGVIAFVIYCRIRRWDVLGIGDSFATAVPLGYTFGRIGNFINGELYGRVTAVPWAVRFPDADPVPAGHPAALTIAERVGIEPTGALVNLPRHPSQLYEAALEGVVLWLVLALIVRPRTKAPGVMVGAYLIGYAVARFIAEYFRNPDPGLDYVVRLGPADSPPWLFESLLNITMGQLMSLGMLVVGGLVVVVVRLRHLRRPRVEVFEPRAPRHTE